MGNVEEFRCFIGNLSWSTTDGSLKDAFEKFGHLTEAKVVFDRMSGRSRGFGFVTFDEKEAMEDAIEKMNGIDLDGRAITVDRAQQQNSSRDRDGDREYDRDRGRGGPDRRNDYSGGRDYGGGRGSDGGECFKCGKPGHFARECPSSGGNSRHSGRDSQYGSDRGGDRYSGRTRDDRYRGGDGGYRGGDDRSNRDRSGPYERPRGGPRS